VKRKRVSTLNLILKPELIISVIHNCYLDVTIFSPIQRPKSDVKLEVPTIGLQTLSHLEQVFLLEAFKCSRRPERSIHGGNSTHCTKVGPPH
jgi:hypothetical protein